MGKRYRYVYVHSSLGLCQFPSLDIDLVFQRIDIATINEMTQRVVPAICPILFHRKLLINYIIKKSYNQALFIFLCRNRAILA